jgi:hypothetical protein
MEYPLLLSSFSNQLSRAFSPFCRGKQAGMGLRRPAGLPAWLPPCLPACLPACRLLHLCSLSVSAEEGSLQKCTAHFSLSRSLSLSLCADDVGLRAFLAGGSYLQENTYVFYILRIHCICTSISVLTLIICTPFCCTNLGGFFFPLFSFLFFSFCVTNFGACAGINKLKN